MPIHGDECLYCLSSCFSKSPNFVVKDQRNTFTNYDMSQPERDRTTKLGNSFPIRNTQRGIVEEICCTKV